MDQFPKRKVSIDSSPLNHRNKNNEYSHTRFGLITELTGTHDVQSPDLYTTGFYDFYQ